MIDYISSLDYPSLMRRIVSFTVFNSTKDKFKILNRKEDVEDIYEKVRKLMGRGYPLPINFNREVEDVILRMREGKHLDVSDLVLLSEFLKEVIRIRKDWEVVGIHMDVEGFDALYREIESKVDRDGIKDTASSLLSELRNEERRLRDSIIKKLQLFIMEKGGFVASPEIHYRDRYLILLKRGMEGKVRGIVHGLSSSGHSVYFEPEGIVYEQNSLISVRDEIKLEEKRIVRSLNRKVYALKERILKSFENILEGDAVNARYLYARSEGCVIPEIGDRLKIVKGRHPLIDRNRVVPLDLVVPEGVKVIVVSGPNAGGKTVLLKTVGLFALMVKTGIPIPADEGSMIPWFEKVMVDIGDEQSVEGGVSSFQYHLENLKEIVENVSDRDLVLIDELGTSTSPEEGSAIGVAILKYLRDKAFLTIANTHLEKIKFMVEETDGMVNGHMAFNRGPEYRFILGTPGISNALYLAEKVGLPEVIVKNARDAIDRNLYEITRLIEKLERKLYEVDRRERELRELEEGLDRREREVSKLERELKERLKRFKKEVNRERRRIVSETRREMENLIRMLRESQGSRDAIKKAKSIIERRLEEVSSTEDEVEEVVDVKVGDTVYVEKFKKEGEVLDVDGDRCTVQIGVLKFNIERKGLKVVKRREENSEIEFRIPEESFSPVLHIRHKTRDEAIEMVDRFIDRALLYGFNRVYIVHGKHGGVLRKALWDVVRRDKRVISFKLADEYEGGRGVTVLELKNGRQRDS